MIACASLAIYLLTPGVSGWLSAYLAIIMMELIIAMLVCKTVSGAPCIQGSALTVRRRSRFSMLRRVRPLVLVILLTSISI
jgi:hypothetical protein